MEILCGTGGWAYFYTASETDALSEYSRIFDFVEVNSTFYEYPSPELVTSWRNRVPSSFTFAVRCNKEISHLHRLKPVEQTFRASSRILEISKILGSPIVVVQTPRDFSLDESSVESVDRFFASEPFGDLQIVWEIRHDGQLPESLIEVMQRHNVLHSVDISHANPSVQSKTMYSRLFGKGTANIHQFDDDELAEIHSKATKFDRSILAFHGVRMYADASRFKHYDKTGEFLPVTSTVGLDSLRESLREDARFPASKNVLVHDYGWKLFDAAPGKRHRAGEVLRLLPEGNYRSLNEVMGALAKVDLPFRHA